MVDTDEIKKEKKEVLLAKIEAVTRNLRGKKKKVSDAKEEADRKNTECVEKIAARKRRLIQTTQKCDQLMDVVNKKIRHNDATEKLAFINECSGLLDGIRERINKEVITCEEIDANIVKVGSVEHRMKDHLSGNMEVARSFSCCRTV